jgi:hypothetical protein
MRGLQQEAGRTTAQVPAALVFHPSVPSAASAIRAPTSTRHPAQHSPAREVTASDGYGCVEWFAYKSNPPASD